jgi:hypothetical protein
MKVKVVAATLLAANFTFTSVANSQQFGYGLYGGNVPCGYNTAPAPGATSDDDELAALLETQRDLKKEARDLEREIDRGSNSIRGRMDKLREEIEKDFYPRWATVFLRHMDGQMNCDICGVSSAPLNPPPAYQPAPPPVYNPPPAVYQPPTVVTSPVIPPPSSAPVESDPSEPVPVAPPPRRYTPPPPPRSMPDEGGDLSDVQERAYEKCLRDHANDPRWNGPKWRNATKQERLRACASGRPMAANDEPATGRMPASTSGNRMPASFSETGVSGSRPPVSSGSDVPTAPGDEEDWQDFDPGRGGYVGGGGGPQKCYNREDKPYRFRSWKFACGEGGHLNPEVCRTNGYVQGTPNYNHCVSALDRYLKLAIQLDRAQARLRDLNQEIDDVGQDIADYKDDHRHRDSSDDAILEASAQRRAQAKMQRSGPSFGQALLGVGLGLAGGIGAYALVHGQERSDWRANNKALTSLGWQTLPYHDSGAGLGAGLGVFSAITGGLQGAYGCGSTYGGVNPGLFGNPYAMNPYAMMGGGMYNGAGPWGMSGPWGYNPYMMGGGGMMVGGIAGGFAGMPPYAGGFAGIPGGFAGMAGGYPGGMMMGAPYVGGVVGGITGGLQGYFPGGFAGMTGYPGGYAGMAGMMGGYAGGMMMGAPYVGGIAGGITGYGAMTGGYLGSYMGGYAGMAGMMGGYAGADAMRAYANQQGTAIQYSQLANQIYGAQQQMQLLQYGQITGGIGGISGITSYPYYGGSIVGGILGGITSYNPYSIYPYATGTISGSILSPTPTILPTTTTTTVPTRTR